MPGQTILALSLKCVGRGLPRRQPAAKQYLLIGEVFCSLLEVTCARKGAEEYTESAGGHGLCAPQPILGSLVEEEGNLISPEHDYNVQRSQFYF